jgi:hypothetical protein
MIKPKRISSGTSQFAPAFGGVGRKFTDVNGGYSAYITPYNRGMVNFTITQDIYEDDSEISNCKLDIAFFEELKKIADVEIEYKKQKLKELQK